jgi:predicted glycosyltransferase
MFLLLREPDAEIWRRKTDWIIRQGGMVLMNVHPDYIDMTGTGNRMTYPLAHYEGFLRWVREHYKAEVWPALPREISQFVRAHQPVRPEASEEMPTISSQPNISGVKVWIDLENTPHIPFFLPIIRELRNRGHQVVLTARNGQQTCEIAGFHSLDFQQVGHHYGRHLIAKIWGLLVRSGQLMCFALYQNPALALNLGSRSQNLAAKLLGIPVVEIMDYEHTAESSLLESRWYLTPEVVNANPHKRSPSDRIRTYDGIKEDVYVPDFKPDESILDHLGLREAKVVVTARPPATEAHYHNPEAEVLFARFMERALASPGVKTVLLPRSPRQKADLRGRYPAWFTNPKLVVPHDVIDGLNLIWHSDLVVSGGGTMNREAAAMGVPVYSVFRGPSGAVDRHLSNQRRLILIETPDDVDHKILLEHRSKGRLPESGESGALADILKHLNAIIASLRGKPPETVGREGGGLKV